MNFFNGSFVIFLLVAILTACGPKLNLSKSFLAEERPIGAATAVAEDLAQSLAAVYPPGHTTLFLSQTGLPQDELGPALETALRALGFALAPEAGGEAQTVTYVLDQVDDSTWYSKLSVSDGLTIARTYQAAQDQWAAAAATRTGPKESDHD